MFLVEFGSFRSASLRLAGLQLGVLPLNVWNTYDILCLCSDKTILPLVANAREWCADGSAGAARGSLPDLVDKINFRKVIPK